MEYKYDEKLRKQMIEYFEVRYSLTISDEEADEYLHAIGGLFLAVHALRE